MAILTGSEIKNRLGKDIIINPYKEENVNPNSYNVTLDNKLLVYTEYTLDCKNDNPTEEIIIPDTGYVLMPNMLYLANTVEHTETYNLVPILSGRSSLARLGNMIHITAGYGDDSFRGKWTLEIMVAQQIKIYPYMSIGQIYYNTIEGNTDMTYKGKYQDNNAVQASMFYKDFK